MLKIWGRRNSFNVQKVTWLIDELGLSHEHIPAGGKFGGLDNPEFLMMNPHGRIPCILDDETVVWESHAILRYLAARYGHPTFWSIDARERAQIDEWMDWLQTTLQPDFLTGVFWGFYRTPESQRDWNAIRKYIERTNNYFQLLDSILENRLFLSGNAIGLADISVGTTLYRYFSLEIERPKLPNVEHWYKRLQERSAYCKHVMIPFDDMKECLDY